MSNEPIYPFKRAEVARQDLYEIATESPVDAIHAIDRIERRASALDSLPNRGRIPPELLRFHVPMYRELQIPPWRLVYRAYEARAVVQGIFDGRRNLEDVIIRRHLSL